MLKIEQPDKKTEKKCKDWYLIQTKPSSHLLASKHLQQQGFDVFLPFMVKTSKKGKRFVHNKIPLFFNYLFMGTTLNQVPWKSINSTRGVAKGVTMDGIYRTVNIDLIEGLRSRCDMQNVVRSEANITLGDKVRIERGPLAEFICKVEKFADRERVWVLIEMMRQRTRTAVPVSSLSKIY